MWKVIDASVPGSSHVHSGLPCQDARRRGQFDVEDERILLAVCADGAGSAELSDVGAKKACDHFFELAYEALKAPGAMRRLDRAQLLGWYEQIREAIEEEAARREVPSRQLACTLLTAIVGEHRALFAQVGDGSIVYRDGEAYAAVFWPQVGEYANMTNFVTQEGLARVFEFEELEERVDELALFTDGLQRIALDFSKKAPHQRFFTPLFAPLRSAEDDSELNAPLIGFLGSPQVNSRTDDDKTLILATRISSHASDDAG